MKNSEQETTSRLAIWIRNLVIGSLVLYAGFRYFTYVALEEAITSYGTASSITQLLIVAAMCFLLLAALTRRLPRMLRIARDDLLYLFIFLLIGGPLLMGASYFLTHNTYQYYTAETSDAARSIVEQPLPRIAPGDEGITNLYRGTEDGSFDWRAWIVADGGGMPPLVAWGGFIFFFAAICFSLVFIFSKRWLEEEQLAFPLEKAAGYLLAGGEKDGGFGGERVNLLSSRAFWIGFMLTLAFQMLTYLNPGLEHRVGSFDIPQTVPLLGDLDYSTRTFWWRPLFLGLFFLCPRDILGSMIVFHLLQVVFTLFGFSFGYEGFTGSEIQGAPVFPFKANQLLGGAVALTIIMFWMSRKYLSKQLVAALLWPSMSEQEREAAGGHYPLRIPVFIFSVVGFVGWSLAIGLLPMVILFFLCCIILGTVVNARGRAETGMPTITVFSEFRPFAFVPLFGTGFFGAAALASFALHGWLFPNNLFHSTPAVMDSMKLGNSAKKSYTWVFSVAAAGMIMGILIGGYVTMRSAYDVGLASWGMRWGRGTMEAGLAHGMMERSPTGPNLLHSGYAFGGAAVTAGIWFLRKTFAGFGLHPMGYLLSLHPGLHHFQLSLYIAFIVKGLCIHYGGMKTYLKLVPMFIGLAFGQIAGAMIGGLLNLLRGTDIYLPPF